MRKKLSKYAKDNGLSYMTAYRYFNNGLIRGIKMPNGTILIDLEETEHVIKKDNGISVILYARVSPSDDKNELKIQLNRLKDYASAKGYIIVDEVSEIGTDLNDRRKKLSKVLMSDNWDKIIVEHKDRFGRFGFEFIKLLLGKEKKEIEVINKTRIELDEKHSF